MIIGNHERKSKNERGNVLFIILIAIALFSALSFVVSGMLRQDNTSMITEQKAKVIATEILDYSRAIRQAVQNLRINGCDESEISFTREAGDVYEHASENVNCQVFHPSGGGINYQVTPGSELDWVFRGTFAVNNIGTTCFAASCVEILVAAIIEDVAICNAINTALNLPSDIDGVILPALIGPVATPYFDGTFSYVQNIGVIAPELDEKMAGCMTGSAAYLGSVFYQVLVVR